MSRDLSDAERAVLTALIERGSSSEGVEVTDADRTAWLAVASQVSAGEACRCGTCPSIELEAGARRLGLPLSRVVLEAFTPDAMLLLFVDDGVPGYLELAPLGDEPILDWPAVSEMSFG